MSRFSIRRRWRIWGGSRCCWRGIWSIWSDITTPKTSRTLIKPPSTSSRPLTPSRGAVSCRCPSLVQSEPCFSSWRREESWCVPLHFRLLHKRSELWCHTPVEREGVSVCVCFSVTCESPACCESLRCRSTTPSPMFTASSALWDQLWAPAEFNTDAPLLLVPQQV